jgi:perosamine synthetase
MIARRVPPVASPISPASLVSAFADSFRAPDQLAARARSLVEVRYEAARAVLTDSGTSALVLALRLTVPPGGVVGFPGYACADLAAAARFAGVRVRLYDIDPGSLSPDLDSVDRALARGVDALVVAHLFGYPADVPAVRERAAKVGVPVIEDAAQGTGGTLQGRRLGSLGELSVLSFGRGKGLCAGGGGALLGFEARWADAMGSLTPRAPSRGLANLAKTAAQWALGRPSVYALPSMVPGLHLGEMVYHPAHEPASLSLGSCSLLASAIALEDTDVAMRRANARRYRDVARNAARLAPVEPLRGSDGGYLRYAVRDAGGARTAADALGIVRPYPRTLAEQEELQAVLLADEPSTPGASELRRSLFVLPTHRLVSESDVRRISRWLTTR